MKLKVFYRVANNTTKQGLWYDFKGNFTGVIHTKFDFCMNSTLLMPYDSSIKGWLSATDTFSTLFFWFSKEDILRLQEHGYRIAVYAASDFRYYNNHWIIKQDNSILKGYLNVEGTLCELNYNGTSNDVTSRISYAENR
jgi:hypothetical protein